MEVVISKSAFKYTHDLKVGFFEFFGRRRRCRYRITPEQILVEFNRSWGDRKEEIPEVDKQRILSELAARRLGV